MSEIVNDELVEDADIEGLPERSRFGGFLRGTLLGIVVSGGVLLGLTLSQPLPGNLPGLGTVEIDQGRTAETTPAPTQPSQTAETSQAEPSDDRIVVASEPSQDVRSADDDATDARTTATSDAEDAAQPQATAETENEPSSQSASDLTETASDASSSEPSEPATDTTVATETETEERTAESSTEPESASSDSQTELAAVSPQTPAIEQSQPAPPEINLPGPAYKVNASTFDVPDNAPILAIVLEDAGNGSVKADSLGLWPFPVALAISPEGPAANDLAKAARAANHEVLVQMPFARTGQAPGDAELHSGLSAEALTTLTQRSLASMPDALGVVAPADAALLTNSAAMSAVVEPIRKHGFAWIDPTAGNSSVVASLATDTSLVHGSANRIVSAGANAEQVLNGLKSAAFTARQRGNAIVRIAASEQAMAALLTFALENGDNTFRIAPISAVLNRRIEAQ